MTATDVANAALAKIGNQRISAFGEASPQAEMIRTQWDRVRRALLRAREWNFASTPASLSEVSSAEATSGREVFNFQHSWQLPSDSLNIIRVNGVEGGTGRTCWKIAGAILYSDDSEAKIEYTRDVTDCTLWEDDFADAMASYLAAAIAPQMTGDAKIGISLLGLADKSMSNAASADTHEGRVPVINSLSQSPYAQARRGSGSSWADYIISAAAYRDFTGQ